MSNRVSIPVKLATQLIDSCTNTAAALQLAVAVDHARKPKRSVVAAKKDKAPKKATKKDRLEVVQKAVWERAGERCEYCVCEGSASNPLDVDHFWRRVNEESTESCWLLCRVHHNQKHKGPRQFWLTAFQLHCESHGYMAQARKAQEKWEAIELMKQSEAVLHG